MADIKYRVLVVDDEPDNLHLMKKILQDRYRMAFATNGVRALNGVRRTRPDLILLDIMMPEMDGYETCRRLKEDEETRDIPVIFVTAKGKVHDETKGLELGAVDYITKPVSPPIVRARLKNHLELKIAREKIEEKNRRLEEQNKKLIEAEQLREDVERITRHDLKTPLNAIITFPQLIAMNTDLPEKSLRQLGMIKESGLHMLKMINLSLDLFKMERGIYQCQSAKVNILQMLRKIISETEAIAMRKKLTADILINGNPAGNQENFSILGEELLCYSMLANLVKNALEASPREERITITLADEEDMSVIRIHNKGAVPEEIRDRFFEKYVTSGK
ncbi:hybrid sensor histidine kinase/response regulator, partial [Desulfococcaceae bacterium HSG8]|nr:hybrid sensor histidine kinase/response regulator [Desulfococcaceae bacterium HSG8]